MNKLIYTIAILCLLVPSWSCNTKEPPVQQPMAEKIQSAEEKEMIASEAVEKIVIEQYTYDEKGRRDPFLSLVTITKEKPLRKKGVKPIESYDVSELQLLAIAWDKATYYALVMLPDRKAYTIKKGTTLGLRDGKVTDITKDRVLIREYVKDYKGDIKPKDTVLKLHEGEEE